MAGDEMMQAAVIDRFGPPEVLRVSEIPVPVPGDGEVLVRVHGAGVNAIDWKTRSGQGVEVASFPAVLGWDISGTVVAAGPGVHGLGEGDQVFGMLRFPGLAAGYAEYVTAAATELAAKPGQVDHHTAAGAPMSALTAWQTLYEHAGVSAGQRVLVHGAAGGVGHVAVQLARLAGAEVIGTASAGNRDFVLDLGADRVIDYASEPIEDALKDVDAVIDTRGGEDFFRLLGVLRPGGIIVTLLGRDPSREKAASARGLRAGFTYVAPDGGLLTRVAELLAQGELRIAVQQVLPLGQAATAHAIGEGGHVRSRLVLDLG